MDLSRIITRDTDDGKLLQTLQRFPDPVLKMLLDKGYTVSADVTPEQQEETMQTVTSWLLKAGDFTGALTAMFQQVNGITTSWEGIAHILKPSPGVVAHEVCHLIDFGMSGNPLAPNPQTPVRFFVNEHGPILQAAMNEAQANNAPFSRYLRTAGHTNEVFAEMLRMYFNIDEVYPNGSPNLFWPFGANGTQVFKEYCPSGFNFVETALKEHGLI